MNYQKPPTAWLVRNLINIDNDANAWYWAGVFQVIDLDLATAVMIAGPDAKLVAKFLGSVAKAPLEQRR